MDYRDLFHLLAERLHILLDKIDDFKVVVFTLPNYPQYIINLLHTYSRFLLSRLWLPIHRAFIYYYPVCRTSYTSASALLYVCLKHLVQGHPLTIYPLIALQIKSLWHSQKATVPDLLIRNLPHNQTYLAVYHDVICANTDFQDAILDGVVEIQALILKLIEFLRNGRKGMV